MEEGTSSRRKPKKEPSAKEKKLKKDLLAARKKINRLRMQLRRSKKQPKSAAVPMLASSAQKCLPPMSQKLFAAQLKLAKVNKYGRRWSEALKDFALSVYYHSPRTYRFLRKVLTLPSVSTLKRFHSRISINAGVHNHVIGFLKSEVPKWPTSKKLCTLVFDEMSIKKHLQYNSKKDTILGLVDDGCNRKDFVANQTLVMMVKGTVTPWKQVIGHWLTANEQSSSVIHGALFQCLDALESVGLIVTTIICDQGPKNRKIINDLKISHETPFFFFRGKKFFFMWDSPHLIKSIRNNFMKYNFTWLGCTAKWEHLVATVKCDDPLRFRLLPKVSMKHVNFSRKGGFTKMKVKLPTQVLSRSMNVAILVLQAMNHLPTSSLETAKFVLAFNDLFDCFNSSQRSQDKLTYRFPISENSKHKAFLWEMLKALSTAKFVGCVRQPDCLNGWVLNIRSLLYLSEFLQTNYGERKIRTRLLNQDALENTFSVVRQQHGCSDHPTVQQLETGLKALSLSSMAKLPESSNCEDDLEKALVRLSELTPSSQAAEAEEGDEDKEFENQVEGLGSLTLNSTEKCAFHYCCGFILRRFLKKHDCRECKQVLINESDRRLEQNHQLLAYFKGYSEELGQEFGHLFLPTNCALATLLEMEGVFFRGFTPRCYKVGIGRTIERAILMKNIKIGLCTEEQDKNLVSLFVKYRLFWAVRSLNRSLEDHESDQRGSIKKLLKLN